VQFVTKPYPDFFRMTSDRLEDGLRYCYHKHGVEQTTIVCRSNRAATQYNQYIRRHIHFCENEVDAGDILMVVRNNYFWLDPNSTAGFLANGEFVEVRKVRDLQEQFGFRFAELHLQLTDYPDVPPFTAWVMLDTLQSFAPNLSREENSQLYEEINAYYADAGDEKEKAQMVRQDPFLNALQVKYAYALTCHKSQGGQWNAVFIDLGFIPESGVDLELMRWLYTAITRATQEVFLVNFPKEFFK